MSLDPGGSRQSASPTSSGRSSPVPRVSRRTAGDGLHKADKATRRYAATLERALASWEISPQEWADYIAFLGRLLKAIQTGSKDVAKLPHSSEISSKLSQCLNPALPSGVHQKALEVYSYIFSAFGEVFIAEHLHEFLPGLSGVSAFASLAVRPALYTIYEDYIVRLPLPSLRPALKSIILSLLPALEESSEDFERAFAILESLQTSTSSIESDVSTSTNKDGLFWQCLFLAVITSCTRRQGALNYMSRKLPKFTDLKSVLPNQEVSGSDAETEKITPEAELAISPEPGLLVRCFISGLSDSQVLIQRGFLDLLILHLPLSSSVLQRKIADSDLDLLVSAALMILLRREMSLNRRLWSWFLGPETKDIATDTHSSSKESGRKLSDTNMNLQLNYFTLYGRAALERCIRKMLQNSSSKPSDKARPFRICLSLMDKWEIGGTLVPHMLLPGMKSAYEYSKAAAPADSGEVIRSASLFFDGIEAKLVWTGLVGLLKDSFSLKGGDDLYNLRLFAWIIQSFNVRDEEMLTIHIPMALLYLLTKLKMCVEHGISDLRTGISLELVTMLLGLLPPRAFTAGQKSSMINPDTYDLLDSAESIELDQIQRDIESFYGNNTQSIEQGLPYSSQELARVSYSILRNLTLGALQGTLATILTPIASQLLAFTSKLSGIYALNHVHIHKTVQGVLQSAIKSGFLLPFTSLNCMILLISGCPAVPSKGNSETLDLLGIRLASQIWQYLSPRSPKYHVEAVKLIWSIGEISGLQHSLEFALTGLVARTPEAQLICDQTRIEAAQRFTTLWTHSAPASSPLRGGPSTLIRRSSANTNLVDAKQVSGRQKILLPPLLHMIDVLKDHQDPSFEVVKTWLSNLSSLDQVYQLHFQYLQSTLSRLDLNDDGKRSREREVNEAARELEYLLGHYLLIIQNGNDATIQCLGVMIVEGHDGEGNAGIVFLAEVCLKLVISNNWISPSLSRVAIDTLNELISSPAAAFLNTLELERTLMDQLMRSISQKQNMTQAPLMNLLGRSVTLRLTNRLSNLSHDGRPTSAISGKRSSSAGSKTNSQMTGTEAMLPTSAQTVTCLRLGFSSQAARSHLDQWLTLLSNLLPLFADALFSNLISLVECLTEELHKAFEQLLLITRADGIYLNTAPEAEAMILLDSLELVLAQAHESLLNEASVDPSQKLVAPSQNLLSNVTSGVFKAEANPSKTAQANSRLTVILAFQDAIKVSLELWTWANRYSEDVNFDKSSAATASFNSLRLRNRTRHMLEQIFAAEPLESLETVMSRWCYTPDSTSAAATMDLLHVMQGSRPKNVVPAILDALCSRTNSSGLPSSRQSTKAVELTALDVSIFLEAYVQSIEDDAMDEVWSDCITFLRDVLGNPLPYRQVLPALISVISLVAQKIEKTNFGEQRRMRRDLGDIFQRLLTATFTTNPSGYVADGEHDAGSNHSKLETNAARGAQKMELVSVLSRVVGSIDTVLESQERIVSAINNVSANLVGPLLHAKSYPKNINLATLHLLQEMAKKAPTAKVWKRDVADAFQDPRTLATPLTLMEHGWFPVLHQWNIHDKERMPELLSRLTPPSTAGIMFGVGANATRLDADRKTQLNLRRICLLLLSSPEDIYVSSMRVLEEKLVELFGASPSSSPSSAMKSELFMLCRAIVLSTSAVQIAPLWPIINDAMQSAITSLLPDAVNTASFGNLALLQACKLLDLLLVLSPDDFQLHEWLYVADTIDAVYHSTEWLSTSLTDQVSEALTSETVDDGKLLQPINSTAGPSPDGRRPLISSAGSGDKEDWKAMAREDFARSVLRPFLSQLSIHSYEGVYSMESADTKSCRKALLEDLLDSSTIVE